MTLAHQGLCQLGALFLADALLEKRCVIGNTRQVVHNAPSAVQELVNARQAVFVPQQLFVGRRHEQDVRTARIGTVLHNHVLGRYHVALRLRHNLAVAIKHHALAQQVREGFVEIEHAQVTQHFREEAAVQQVQNGVLNAANVLVNGHPAVHLGAVERCFGVMRIGVAHVIPA